MKASDNLDQIFRSKLKDYASEVPMHLFAGVESRRSRKAGFFFWGKAGWLLVGLLLLAGSSDHRAEKAVPSETPNFPIQTGSTLPKPESLEITIPNIERPTPTPLVKPKNQSIVPPVPMIPAVADQEVLTEKGLAAFVTETSNPVRSNSVRLLPPLTKTDLELSTDFLPSGVICSSFKDNDWKWYLDLMLAPAELPVRKLDPKDPEHALYAQSRRDSEQPTYAFSGGGRLSAVAPNGLALRVGLHYSQINELFEYYNPNWQEVVITNYFDENGAFVYSDTITREFERFKETHNRYRFYDIPVLLGYEFELPNFTLTMSGGAYFNLFFQQKGDFNSPDGIPVSFSSSDPAAFPAFRNNLGISLGGNIGFGYRLKNDMEILLEPSFRYLLKPVTLEGYPVSQRYFITGITTGLRIRI